MAARHCSVIPIFFFFNDTATTEIYTLSLHDALPICRGGPALSHTSRTQRRLCSRLPHVRSVLGSPSAQDRKSTRLNSSHGYISYAVFCLKKKNASASSRKTRTLCSPPMQA